MKKFVWSSLILASFRQVVRLLLGQMSPINFFPNLLPELIVTWKVKSHKSSIFRRLKRQYPGPRPRQSRSLPWHEERLKSQGFPLSVQKAPSTFGVTSPTFDWQNAPTNSDPSFFLTLKPWLLVLLQGFPPVALIVCAFSTIVLVSFSNGNYKQFLIMTTITSYHKK